MNPAGSDQQDQTRVSGQEGTLASSGGPKTRSQTIQELSILKEAANVNKAIVEAVGGKLSDSEIESSGPISTTDLGSEFDYYYCENPPSCNTICNIANYR